MMRNWSWLLISLAAAAHAEPPRQLEIVFTMSRNGALMAEVVERLEYVQGNYKLTETWKGKGIYALLGAARRERIRTPVGEFDTVKVARQGDERETAELWLAAERAFIPVRLLVVEKDGTRYEQVATRISQ